MGRLGAIALGLIATVVTFASCNITLFAPQGSGIVLTPSATTIAPDGSVTITATVTENARIAGTTTTPPGQTQTSTYVGPFVHNGTVVDFTTTIGSIDPVESFTQDGKVTVTFFANGQTGTATVTASSGSITKTLTITIAAPGGN